jgi:cytochrome c peroxidase
VVAALLFVAAAAAYEWDLPAGFPAPVVPADDPMNAAKVALGGRLFGDERLSVTGSYSCASCHDPARAFTDGRPRAVGATGDVHPRNTPTLLNAAYAARLGWLATGPESLEAQIRIALVSEEPVELGFARIERERLETLRTDATLAAEFATAFDEPIAALSTPHLVQALASYVRTLVSADSAFDRYVYWGEAMPSAAARAGLELFLSERAGCAGCHDGFNLSGSSVSAEKPAAEARFVRGIRVPTLRNVALTAPYFHDGSRATLDAVLDFYTVDGHGRPISFTPAERCALLAFLRSVTSPGAPGSIETPPDDASARCEAPAGALGVHPAGIALEARAELFFGDGAGHVPRREGRVVHDALARRDRDDDAKR